MKTITPESFFFKKKYKQWPEWRKFLHAWVFTVKSSGVKAIWGFPITYWQLRRTIKKMNNDTSKK